MKNKITDEYFYRQTTFERWCNLILSLGEVILYISGTLAVITVGSAIFNK